MGPIRAYICKGHLQAAAPLEGPNIRANSFFYKGLIRALKTYMWGFWRGDFKTCLLKKDSEWCLFFLESSCAWWKCATPESLDCVFGGALLKIKKNQKETRERGGGKQKIWWEHKESEAFRRGDQKPSNTYGKKYENPFQRPSSTLPSLNVDLEKPPPPSPI